MNVLRELNSVECTCCEIKK